LEERRVPVAENKETGQVGRWGGLSALNAGTMR
jgi:hypothetical protein